MSENNIYNGTFVLGDVSATTLSAGEGIKITTDEPGVIKVSNDETVLWSGAMDNIPSTATLSESYKNFETIKIYAKTEDQYNCTVTEYPNNTDYFNILIHQAWPGTNTAYWDKSVTMQPNNDYTKISACFSTLNRFASGNSVSVSFRTTSTTGSSWVRPFKIVGINRISGGN